MAEPQPAARRWRAPYLALAAVTVALLFYLGAQPFAAGLIPPPWDKLAHFVAYAAIAGLLCLGTGCNRPWLLIAVIGAIGAIDEWHQTVLPGRFAEFADLLADVSAAICAVMLYEFLWARREATAATPGPPGG